MGPTRGSRPHLVHGALLPVQHKPFRIDSTECFGVLKRNSYQVVVEKQIKNLIYEKKTF